MMRRARTLLGWIAAVALLHGCQAREVELNVMSSGGFTAAYQVLAPAFTEATGVRLETVYGASMGGAPESIPSRLERGEPADVVILASAGLETLIADGKVRADSRVDLASSLVGMAVRAGSPVPDIGDVEALKRVLLEADSVAYSASASGTYLSTELFPRLGIAEELQQKSLRVVGERVGAVVARGEAQIGFQQVSELLPIEGITYVGPIPDEVQEVTVFSAGITTRCENVEAATALIAYLASPQSSPAIAETGMEPATETVVH